FVLIIRMDITLTKQEKIIFEKLSQAAQALGIRAYVIGGFVRDKLLQRACKDIDVTCVGDGILLAQKAAAQFPDATRISIFKNFGTAHFKTEEYEIEFVGARKESYAPESRNPAVTPGSLEDDQHRRDF